MRDFLGFHSKIPDAVKGSIRPLLSRMHVRLREGTSKSPILTITQSHQSRAIHKALLVADEGVVEVGIQSDQLAVVANLQVSILSLFWEFVLVRKGIDACSLILLWTVDTPEAGLDAPRAQGRLVPPNRARGDRRDPLHHSHVANSTVHSHRRGE